MALPLSTGGGSSAYGLGPAQNTFTNAAERDTYAAANAAWLADYNANRFFWIRTGTNIQRRNAAGTGWENVTTVVQGRRGIQGAPGSDATVNAANVDPIIAAYTGQVPGLTIPDAQLPDSIMRDAEFTAAAIRALLGLTAQEVDDFFVGAIVSGTGTTRIITVTQADGSTITLAIPQAAVSGGGSDDGVVVSGAFNGDGTSLTLTLSTGSTISISVPAVLRAAPVEINPAGAATDVATKIEVNGTIYSFPTAAPAQAEHIRAGWSADSNISAAELTATSATDTITLPTAAGNQYLGLWRADADGGDPTEVHISGGGNSRNLFGVAADLTLAGTAGKVIVSVNQFNAALTGGESVRLV